MQIIHHKTVISIRTELLHLSVTAYSLASDAKRQFSLRYGFVIRMCLTAMLTI